MIDLSYLRNSQPQGPVEVDRGAQLARGLTNILRPDFGLFVSDQITNTFTPVTNNTGMSESTTLAGKGIRRVGDAVNTGYIQFPVSDSPSGDRTYLVVHVPDAASGNQALLDDDGSPRRFQFRLNGSSVEFIWFNTGGSAFTASVANSVAVNRLNVSIAVKRGANAWVANNGVISNETAITGTPQTGVTLIREFNRKQSTYSPYVGSHQLVAIWDRALSVSEIATLSANPWQLFRPIQRRIWVPVAGGGGISQTVAFTLEDVSAAVSQNLSHAQSLTGMLDDVAVSISQTAQHSQALDATLDGVTFAASQTLSHSQALAATLDGVTVEINQSAAPSSKDQSLAVVLDGIQVAIAQEGPANLIDTHDGFWAKEWARIRAREKRKYQEEIQERVEEIQDEIAEVEQQIAEVKQAPKPKKATPARDFYAEQARIVEHLIARRNQLIDEEDEELLLLL